MFSTGCDVIFCWLISDKQKVPARTRVFGPPWARHALLPNERSGGVRDVQKECLRRRPAFALVSFRFARYTVLTSPNKDETAVHGYGLTFIGSVVVLVSRKAISFYVLSALQLCCMSVDFLG